MDDRTSLHSGAAQRATIDSATARATQAFLRHLAQRYSIREAILFGGRARRNHRPDSDADIAVVLDGAHGDRTAAALDMAGIAFNVMLETGVMVEALPLWTDDLEYPDTFHNPRLLDRIRREGIRL
jgi:uncharacterized protein